MRRRVRLVLATWVVIALAAFLVRCAVAPNVEVVEPPNYMAQGLSASEREQLFHLAEGSEVFPLSWMRALESEQTKQPFLLHLDRFGLLPDPDDPNGLPVGMTVELTSDTRFLGEPMVGVNCAACHVGEIRRGKQSLRILGAPNMFDIEAFFTDLALSIIATTKSAPKLVGFLRRLSAEPKGPAIRVETKKMLETSEDTEALRKKGELGSEIASRLDVIVDESSRGRRQVGEAKVAPLDSKPKPSPTSPELGDKLERLLPQQQDGALLGGAEPSEQRNVVKDFFSHISETLRLLQSRAALMERIGATRVKTPGGFGRADAFGSARNLIFAPEEMRAKTAPVSFPAIWGFGDLDWLHWDANTNSVVERNMGQAIGLGAVFDGKTFESTVQPRNLHRLEVLARRIAPPRWPEDLLGKIDRERAARGKVVFQKNCATCHSPESVHDRKRPYEEVGTDAERAQHFSEPLASGPFPDALSGFLAKIKAKAYEMHGVTDAEAKEFEMGRVPSRWRGTKCYVERPLVAVWATAPYLHNGSVPTIKDLLLPAEKRPRKFWVGHRDYDPEALGYSAKKVEGDFLFETILAGNSNAGHEYGIDLPESDKLDLIEHLKGE
ncbi:hypothetical protein HY251_14120 [bacterium]|nr:hypothetical protein [bacterium]